MAYSSCASVSGAIPSFSRTLTSPNRHLRPPFLVHVPSSLRQTTTVSPLPLRRGHATCFGGDGVGDYQHDRVVFPRPAEIPWKRELANTVHLIGNVGAPVQIKHFSSGKVVAWTRLAVKKSPTETTWINLSLWDELAHVAFQHVEKGQQVYVSGRLVSDSVEGEEDKKQVYYKVVVQQLNFIERTMPPVSLYNSDESSTTQWPKASQKQGGSVEELWQAYFTNPTEWWDNRNNKIQLGLESGHEMEPVMIQNPQTSSSMPETRIVCRVCEKQFAKYTCPRCNSRYCSLQCYKEHSARCTESFMRDNVIKEMQSIQTEDKTKRKMMDILKRFHSEEDVEIEEEDDSTLSQETIQKFLSGNNLQLEDLSTLEMKQFQRAVASGQLSKMIKPWEPWWLRPSARTISLGKDGTQLVSSINKCDSRISLEETSDSNLSDIPCGPETPLPPLSKLSSKSPSPLLGIHVVDVLYSYCFTLRLYNGDWNCDALGAAVVILNISSVLGNVGQPETVSEALSNCIEETCSPIYRHAGGFHFATGLVDDVITLLSLGTNALICLLCDLRRLILAGQVMLKTEKVGKTKRDENKIRLKNADRKIVFLMCWVHEQPNAVWYCIQNMVTAERTSLLKVELEHKCSPVQTKGKTKCSVLIEECK